MEAESKEAMRLDCRGMIGERETFAGRFFALSFGAKEGCDALAIIAPCGAADFCAKRCSSVKWDFKKNGNNCKIKRPNSFYEAFGAPMGAKTEPLGVKADRKLKLF